MTRYLHLTVAAYYYRNVLPEDTQKFLVVAGVARSCGLMDRLNVTLPWDQE